MNLFKFA